MRLAWSSAGKEFRNLSGISWMASARLKLPDSSPEQEISMKRRAGKGREFNTGWQTGFSREGMAAQMITGKAVDALGSGFVVIGAG